MPGKRSGESVPNAEAPENGPRQHKTVRVVHGNMARMQGGIVHIWLLGYEISRKKSWILAD
ncbi:hypothetical protein BTA30_19215 [Bacillus swezeyi]|uniref:Uncharacterized protein n=1 Tax=Bacillus swezeyi TaxID=1925020 RepID=A0A1R1RJZ1_9BACI|nr:hypothetical protein BW143_12970 [Bacillus swezeyi]OMI26342.1 hypothetical protein BTA30_19215 [Bacillus swezeyi]